MTTLVYLRPNAIREIRLPSAVPRATDQPGVRVNGPVVTFDTGDRELRQTAWRNAADALTHRPPGCPDPDLVSRYMNESADPRLADFWPDWVRITTNLALRCPDETDRWAADLASDAPLDVASGALAVLERWRELEPVDLWGLYFRSPTGAAEGRNVSGLTETERREPTCPLDAILPQTLGGRRALGQVFAWRSETAADVRPTLLDLLFVPWPAENPVLKVHVGHPAHDALWSHFPPPELAVEVCEPNSTAGVRG
jgi:hypothetical protein